MSERMNYQRNTNRRSAPHSQQRSQQKASPVRSATVELAKAVLDREGAFDGFAVAMTYTPWQRWGEVYHAEKGLDRGTIFPALDMPFSGRRC